MSARKCRAYDAQFKKNFVLLCNKEGRLEQTYQSLGILKVLFYHWNSELTA